MNLGEPPPTPTIQVEDDFSLQEERRTAVRPAGQKPVQGGSAESIPTVVTSSIERTFHLRWEREDVSSNLDLRKSMH